MGAREVKDVPDSRTLRCSSSFFFSSSLTIRRLTAIATAARVRAFWPLRDQKRKKKSPLCNLQASPRASNPERRCENACLKIRITQPHHGTN